jgi:hypothetical protein
MYALLSVKSLLELNLLLYLLTLNWYVPFWIFRWRLCNITSQSRKTISCKAHACHRLEILEVLSVYIICQIYHYTYARQSSRYVLYYVNTSLPDATMEFLFLQILIILCELTFFQHYENSSEQKMVIVLAWSSHLVSWPGTWDYHKVKISE